MRQEVMTSSFGRIGMKTLVVLAALAVPLAGCSDMNATQQRALTGTVGGAGVGAILGAIGGNAGLGAAAGAAAGLAGGLIYEQGYAAGQRNRPPQQTQ
jgi:hypothetical protein